MFFEVSSASSYGESWGLEIVVRFMLQGLD